MQTNGSEICIIYVNKYRVRGGWYDKKSTKTTRILNHILLTKFNSKLNLSDREKKLLLIIQYYSKTYILERII